MTTLKLAIPSKGRLKEQTDAYLKDCGLRLKQTGGDRSYTANLEGAPNVEVLLLSASEIAKGVLNGDLHLGVTGEDLLQEHATKFDEQVFLLKALGFGFARMVVAVPESWVDVDTIEDLEEVGHIFRARHSRRMRAATKYLNCSRRFFAEKGLTQYRLVDSAGATEAAPTSGSAELIVDITTTGSTLRANNLKILSDGQILASEAQLTASKSAEWSDETLNSLKVILDLIEARQRAKSCRVLVSDKDLSSAGDDVGGNISRINGNLVVPTEKANEIGIALAGSGYSPVMVQKSEFIFLEQNQVLASFENSLKLGE